MVADAVASVDITAPDGPSKAVEFAVSRFGRIDFLINNAGTAGAKNIRDSDDSVVDAFWLFIYGLRSAYRASA